MDFATLASLIFATLVGILPILLLIGRRRMASMRQRREADASSEQAAAAADSSPDAAGRRPSDDGASPGGGMGTRRRGRDPDADLRVSPVARGSGDPAEESMILQRLIRERREAVAATNKSPAVQARLLEQELHDAARLAGATPPSAEARLEERIRGLSYFQRAIVYGEVLGKPVGLRAPGEWG